jgi:hypothetical protein
MSRMVLRCFAAAMVLTLVVCTFAGCFRQRRQVEEWNVSKFQSEVENGSVQSGHFSGGGFTGQTKKGEEFTVNLPGSPTAYWIRLLDAHNVSLRVSPARFAGPRPGFGLLLLLPIAVLWGLIIYTVILVIMALRKYLRK